MAKELKLPQLTQQQIQILAAVVIGCAALGFIYWKYFWSPVSERIQTATEKLEKVEKDIAMAVGQEKRLAGLKVDVAKLKEQKKAAEHRLPKDKDVSGVIDILTDLGRRHNIEIHSINPKGVKTKQYYAEISYGLTLSGDYHSIGRFITALGTLERIFSTHNLSLSGGSGESLTLKANLTLVAYQYKG